MYNFYYMPKYYGRRKTYKRFNRKANVLPWYSKKYSVGDMATAALRGVYKLKGLVNSEKYHLDGAWTTAASTTPVINHLTGIGQGDNDPGRTGNSMLVRGLNLNGIFTMNPSAETTYVRCVLVRDKQQIGDGIPVWTDVFETSTPTSLMNHLTLGRFDVLYDRIFTFTKGGKESVNFRKSLKMYSHVRFNGTAGSDIQKNGIYLMYLSDQATNTASVNLITRVLYHDN